MSPPKKEAALRGAHQTPPPAAPVPQTVWAGSGGYGCSPVPQRHARGTSACAHVQAFRPRYLNSEHSRNRKITGHGRRLPARAAAAPRGSAPRGAAKLGGYTHTHTHTRPGGTQPPKSPARRTRRGHPGVAQPIPPAARAAETLDRSSATTSRCVNPGAGARSVPTLGRRRSACEQRAAPR